MYHELTISHSFTDLINRRLVSLRHRVGTKTIEYQGYIVGVVDESTLVEGR
jgi:hypothetical protein